MVLKLDGAGQNGLEEDKITWYSNTASIHHQKVLGLEEDKITWYSNAIPTSFQIWEAEKITGFSNMDQICSNACAVWESGRNYRALKRKVLWF